MNLSTPHCYRVKLDSWIDCQYGDPDGPIALRIKPAQRFTVNWRSHEWDEPNYIGRMGTSSVRSLTRQLERLDPGDVLDVRTLPRIVADWYSIADEKAITISGRTRNHYSKGHPWLGDKHDEVIWTLLYPRKIVLDKANLNRVLFYRRSIQEMDVLVVVEIKKARGISHRVVTAFEVGLAEVARRKPIEQLLWGGGGVKRWTVGGDSPLPHFLTLQGGMHPASMEIFDSLPTIFYRPIIPFWSTGGFFGESRKGCPTRNRELS